MGQDRIHRAVSDDGTEIVGRVSGQGPPLVLVHGVMADGESEWAEVLPWLTGRFTCYRPSTRGRGLSAAHPDLSPEARVADVTAFIDSIGEPVRLAGVSGGGMLALGAAARTSAVTAVAVWEPVVYETIGEQLLARMRHTLDTMTEAADQGRLGAAVQAFLELAANEDEKAALAGDDPEGLEGIAQYLPVDLEELRTDSDILGPSPTDPGVLERIAVPVLILHGSKTALSWFADGARHAAEHVPDATRREIPNVGHLAQLAAPERVAAEFVPFLESLELGHQPA